MLIITKRACYFKSSGTTPSVHINTGYMYDNTFITDYVTITTDGNFKVHTFTGDGNFVVTDW